MSERIRGSYDDALYKSTYTLLYFTLLYFNGSFDPHESALKTAYRSFQPLLHSSSVCLTHTESTLDATSVALARIYAVYAIRPKK